MHLLCGSRDLTSVGGRFTLTSGDKRQAGVAPRGTWRAKWRPWVMMCALAATVVTTPWIVAAGTPPALPQEPGEAPAPAVSPPAGGEGTDDNYKTRVSPTEPAAKPVSKLTARAWDYIPYRVVVWIVDDNSQVLHHLFPELKQRIERDARIEEYNAWSVVCRHANPLWNYRFATGLQQPAAPWTTELAELAAAEDIDKLIVIRLMPAGGHYSLLARELDMMTRQWGEPAELPCGQLEMLPAQCYASIRQAFMPLTRIERISDKTIYCRMRAVNLCRTFAVAADGNPQEVPAEDSPIWVHPADVMLPVIRRNDRDNQFSSVEIADLTFLTIESQAESVLKCFMYTAQWAPLSGRTGSRTQKFALVVRPHGLDTRLTLVSSDPKNPAPLSGLGIYSRTPANPELPERERKELEKQSEVPIGKTDWKGSIRIPPAADGGVRLVYVKNGKKELKMIPVMPGLFPSLRAPVQDDKARVYAEGVANGWKNRILDFVARRTILESRMAIAVENSDFDKARKIHDNEYKDLQAYEASFDYLLKESKNQLLSRKDANDRQRELIHTMFDNLDKVITKNVKKPENTALFDQILNRDPGENAEEEEESEPGADAKASQPTPNPPPAAPPAQRTPNDTSDF